jgi:hypothetical protein
MTSHLIPVTVRKAERHQSAHPDPSFADQDQYAGVVVKLVNTVNRSDLRIGKESDQWNFAEMFFNDGEIDPGSTIQGSAPPAAVKIQREGRRMIAMDFG